MAGLVGEFSGVVTVGADPNVRGPTERVDASQGPERGEEVDIAIEDATLDNLADVG